MVTCCSANWHVNVSVERNEVGKRTGASDSSGSWSEDPTAWSSIAFNRLALELAARVEERIEVLARAE
jgi:hypothetical protein